MPLGSSLPPGNPNCFARYGFHIQNLLWKAPGKSSCLSPVHYPSSREPSSLSSSQGIDLHAQGNHILLPATRTYETNNIKEILHGQSFHHRRGDRFRSDEEEQPLHPLHSRGDRERDHPLRGGGGGHFPCPRPRPQDGRSRVRAGVFQGDPGTGAVEMRHPAQFHHQRGQSHRRKRHRTAAGNHHSGAGPVHAGYRQHELSGPGLHQSAGLGPDLLQSGPRAGGQTGAGMFRRRTRPAGHPAG